MAAAASSMPDRPCGRRLRRSTRSGFASGIGTPSSSRSRRMNTPGSPVGRISNTRTAPLPIFPNGLRWTSVDRSLYAYRPWILEAFARFSRAAARNDGASGRAVSWAAAAPMVARTSSIAVRRSERPIVRCSTDPRTRSHSVQSLCRSRERFVALGEAEPQDRPRFRPAVEKRRERDRREAVFPGPPQRELLIPLIADRRIIEHLKERAAAGQRAESRAGNQRQESIAPLLVELCHLQACRIRGDRLRVGHLDRRV